MFLAVLILLKNCYFKMGGETRDFILSGCCIGRRFAKQTPISELGGFPNYHAIIAQDKFTWLALHSPKSLESFP